VATDVREKNGPAIISPPRRLPASAAPGARRPDPRGGPTGAPQWPPRGAPAPSGGDWRMRIHL